MGTAVGAGEYAITAGEAFVWRSGHAEVTLSYAGDAWTVVYSATGRLLGPPQVLHKARHHDPTHAAWDVMARVQLASRNPDEGVRAGRSAARWIKSRPARGGFAVPGHNSQP
jgi:hypothetical protein